MKKFILNYNSPAKYSDNGWQNEVLPVGNGKIGACIFGGVDCDILQLNEKTLWAGGPSPKRPNYNGGNLDNRVEYLKQVQTSLAKGNYHKVQNLKKYLIGEKDGYGNYLNYGEIHLDFGHKDISNYKRTLDINEAIAKVEYNCNGVNYNREYFCNYPNNVLAVKISSDKLKAINCSISFNFGQKVESLKLENGEIVLFGRVEDNNLKTYAKISINTCGNILYEKEKVIVEQASELIIYFSAITDYANIYPNYRCELLTSEVDSNICNAITKGYNKLKTEHISDYQSLFNRVEFNISKVNQISDCTDELLSTYKKDINNLNSRYLEELLFQYGRYLIISSSRLGSLPANLQGIWNNSDTPAWGCDYHLNVNLQMCYWHVYSTNLTELAIPMIDYIDSLREPGRVTAKEYHNIISQNKDENNGWVCHTQNTPFGWTCPGWEFNWGWSPSVGSWMMQNVFDYYEYTQDKSYLKNKIYPMLKETAKFWMQNLIYDSVQKRYVSSPTFSPEHGPITVGNTYEQTIIYMLFEFVNKAGTILGDIEFVEQVNKLKNNLNPIEIGKWGQIKEWFEEDDWYKHEFMKSVAYKKRGCQNKHRHASHLLGLYPYNFIDNKNQKLLNAAAVSLVHRGGDGAVGMNDSGWGKANKICMWARVKNGENAHKMIQNLISGNIAKNLWDLHPPYQMDGNCGYTAGVAEMVLYSNDDYIELLPALPKNWENGNIKGLLARGGYELDFAWENGVLTALSINSKIKNKVQIYINDRTCKFLGADKAKNGLCEVKVTNKNL